MSEANQNAAYRAGREAAAQIAGDANPGYTREQAYDNAVAAGRFIRSPAAFVQFRQGWHDVMGVEG